MVRGKPGPPRQHLNQTFTLASVKTVVLHTKILMLYRSKDRNTLKKEGRNPTTNRIGKEAVVKKESKTQSLVLLPRTTFAFFFFRVILAVVVITLARRVIHVRLHVSSSSSSSSRCSSRIITPRLANQGLALLS